MICVTKYICKFISDLVKNSLYFLSKPGEAAQTWDLCSDPTHADEHTTNTHTLSPALGCDAGQHTLSVRWAHVGHTERRADGRLCVSSDSQFPPKHNELQQRADGRGGRDPCSGPTGRCVGTTHTHTHTVQTEPYKTCAEQPRTSLHQSAACQDWADVETQSSFTLVH